MASVSALTPSLLTLTPVPILPTPTTLLIIDPHLASFTSGGNWFYLGLWSMLACLVMSFIAIWICFDVFSRTGG